MRTLSSPASPRTCSLPRQAVACLCLIVAGISAAWDGQPVRAQEVSALSQLRYRSIGPFRGGRSAAAAGVPGKPMLYYFGATGGGVWKTEDGGATWSNISDGSFGGSIGSVAVSLSDPNTIYVGGGEVTVRGNVSHGHGMWKTQDGGKTWESLGFEDAHHIPRMCIDPRDPDRVYAAVLGHLYGPNQVRGIYRSQDGGKSWQRVLFVNDEVGACDLTIDPNNARVLYATTWRIRRTPYSLESGGEGSGIWKSTDGGDTWRELTRNPGLPQGTVGISGITVSPVNSDRVWAIVEAQDGGVFRSEDAGETWRRINEDRNLRQRAWYYTRIYASPDNEDVVYVLNVQFWKSKDGGSTFSSISTPHSDHHDLWIAPEDPQRMVIADDGGAQVTFNGGQTWSDYNTQPTAQFYRVTTDNHFPYRIYGAQQDNSTVRILSRSDSGTIGERDWEPTAGGESGHIAPHPTNPDIVYGGSYGGLLIRRNHATGDVRSVDVWPDNPMGHGAIDLKFRFQWNFPIFFSPHDPNTLYAAANVLFKTQDQGQSWQQISPDLTRNDPRKLGSSGGPITKDNTSVEYYCTIFAALESPHEPGVLWAGSDDGLLHLSKDGGKTWNNVTPPEMPEWAQLNSLEAHPSEKGGLYVAATRYKLDDFRPYLFKTTDYGRTWQTITDGIHRKHFTRVLRADPHRNGLLYCGTEAGMYVSLDDGNRWQSLQLNLPVVPITDLAVKNDDLIVATQGRSFWILDDLTILQQLLPSRLDKELHLFQPRPVYRFGGRGGRPSRTAGQNPRGGVPFHFCLKEALGEAEVLTLSIQDDKGEVIRTFSTKPAEGEESLRVTKGHNVFYWDMNYPGSESFPGMVMWAGSSIRPTAVPGQYQATVTLGELSESVKFTIKKDPRLDATDEDYQAQFDFLVQVRDKLTETHRTIKAIRDLRSQVAAILNRTKGQEKYQTLQEMGKSIQAELTAIEEALYQTKNQSSQDPLNYPIRLNNRLSALASLASIGSYPPTRQAQAVRQEVEALIDQQIERFITIKTKRIQEWNALADKLDVPAVFVDES